MIGSRKSREGTRKEKTRKKVKGAREQSLFSVQFCTKYTGLCSCEFIAAENVDFEKKHAFSSKAFSAIGTGCMFCSFENSCTNIEGMRRGKEDER